MNFMYYYMFLSISVFATSVIAHLYIRSYLIVSIVAVFLGPFIGYLGYHFVFWY